MTARIVTMWSLAQESLAALLASDRNSAQWDALRVFALRALSAALLFVSQVALARWMGAAEYGDFVSAWTCVLVVGGLSHLGLSIVMLRLVPQYFASGAHDKLRGLLRGGRVMALTTSSIIACFGAALLFAFDEKHTLSISSPVILALLCIPLYALTDVQDGIGRGQGWTVEAIAPPYILRPLLLLLAVGVIHYTALPTTASTAMLGALIATTAAAGIQTLLLERRIATGVPRGASRYDVLEWLKLALPLLAVNAAELVMQNADVLVLNMYRPSNEIGIYYAAAKTATLALFIQYAIGSAYAGRIAAAGGLGDKERVEILVGECVRWTCLPTAATVACLLAVGYPILMQFGDDFTSAYPLMFITSAGVLARACVGPSEVILSMLGQHRACALSYGAAAIVCVLLNLLLVPWFGITGASLAIALALALASALNWRVARRDLGINLFILANLQRNRSTKA